MEQIKKEGNIPLVLDSGNLFFSQNPTPNEMKAQMRLKADLIAEAYKKIGIDALNVGELDLAFGINYLLEKKKALGLPFVSSNLVYRKGEKNVFQPYILKEFDGFKVAIFGLIPLIPQTSIIDNDIKILSPTDTANSMVERLAGKADLIILLSNLGQQEDERLANRVSGIDMIIGGRNQALIQTPLKFGNTLILQAHARGKYVGRLEFNPTTKNFTNTVTPMDDKVSKNEDIEGMIKKYKDALADLHSGKPKQATREAAQKTYVGKAVCAGCHPRQDAFWKGTRHASAYETLVKRNSHLDLECIGCHTTGYGTPGGFTLELENPDLRNVQCEVCHGPGARHSGKGNIRRVVDASLCGGCHNIERDPRFNILSSFEKVRCPG